MSHAGLAAVVVVVVSHFLGTETRVAIMLLVADRDTVACAALRGAGVE